MGDNGIIVQCGNFDFEKYWTDIAIDRQTGIIRIYSSTDGDLNTARLNSNGSITNLSSGTNYIKASRLVVPIGNRMWISYDTKTKEGATFSINEATGSSNRLQGVPELGAPWSIIASNQSTIGFYSASNQVSLIGSTALDGSVIKLKSYAAPGNITQIASALNGPYINYSISTGELSVDKVASDGTATNLQQYAPPK